MGSQTLGGETSTPSSDKKRTVRGVLNFLRSHPVLCLLLLSPGIPEYVSGSSPMNAIILNPIQFIFQVTANLGLYGPGVLLVREAMIRWKKGWASALLLGAAYGILEEGIALSTLFNPVADPVGSLGFYGHWIGVNWIWLSGILTVHMLYSISLPIILLSLALPETARKSFLNSRRKVSATIAILSVDVSLLFLLVLYGEHFWMGFPVLFGSLAAIAALIISAYKIPANALTARHTNPTKGARTFGILGILFYPSILVAQSSGMNLGIPPFLDFLIVILIQTLFLFYVLRNIGRLDNERNIAWLALSMISPIALVGMIAEASLPLTLICDILLIIFFRHLLMSYSPQVKERTASNFIE
jgi:hypothetical protein